MIATWQAPGGTAELAIAFRRNRGACVLVLPALFDEANKLRHLTVETMRALDAAGVDCVLPDLPGCNESPAPLATQTLESWREAAATAARHFGATHILAIRAGALLAPALPGWRLAAVRGEAVLRALLRARVMGSKEAGIVETREELLRQGKAAGLELAGYALGAGLVTSLETAEPAPLTDIAQGALGGPGLWLRAEPNHDPAQAMALARIVLDALA